MQRRVLLVSVVALLMGMVLAVPKAVSKEKKGEAGKSVRWHGHIVRVNADAKTLDVRKGTITRTIHYDDSTQWVKPKGKTTEPIEMSTLKEGDDVICLTTTDEKGDLHASRVQLQPGK